MLLCNLLGGRVTELNVVVNHASDGLRHDALSFELGFLVELTHFCLGFLGKLHTLLLGFLFFALVFKVKERNHTVGRFHFLNFLSRCEHQVVELLHILGNRTRLLRGRRVNVHQPLLEAIEQVAHAVARSFASHQVRLETFGKQLVHSALLVRGKLCPRLSGTHHGLNVISDA